MNHKRVREELSLIHPIPIDEIGFHTRIETGFETTSQRFDNQSSLLGTLGEAKQIFVLEESHLGGRFDRPRQLSSVPFQRRAECCQCTRPARLSTLTIQKSLPLCFVPKRFGSTVPNDDPS
jgi:hypothetical protein